MPYTGVSDPDLPEAVKKLPTKQKKKWVAVFNAAHASCIKDGGSAKKCESSAFAQAWAVSKRQGETMNWLQRLIESFKRSGQSRAIGIDNLMAKIHAQLRERMQDDDYYGYVPTRLMVDSGGLWVIVNHQGELLRYQVTPEDDGEVTLGDPETVVENYTPVGRSIFIHRDKNGEARIYMIAATSILNRVNEIDSRKLFDNMVRHAEESDFYPAIDIHHTGSWNPDVFEIGYIDFLARFGVTYVASGVIDETTELGRRMVRTLERAKQGEWGCSIEYFPLEKEEIGLSLRDNGTIPVDVYTDGVNTRISLLPEQQAANWFTTVTRENNMSKSRSVEALASLRKLFDTDEEFQEFIESAVQVNDEVEKRSLVTRTQETTTAEQAPEQGSAANQDAGTAQEQQEVVRQFELDEAAIAAITEQVVAKLQTTQAEGTQQRSKTDEKLEQILASVNGLNERIAKQDERLQKLERAKDQEEAEWLSDLSPRLRERVMVTYRPTQQARTEETDKPLTSSDIAANTLASLPNVVR